MQRTFIVSIDGKLNCRTSEQESSRRLREQDTIEIRGYLQVDLHGHGETGDDRGAFNTVKVDANEPDTRGFDEGGNASTPANGGVTGPSTSSTAERGGTGGMVATTMDRARTKAHAVAPGACRGGAAHQPGAGQVGHVGGGHVSIVGTPQRNRQASSNLLRDSPEKEGQRPPHADPREADDGVVRQGGQRDPDQEEAPRGRESTPRGSETGRPDVATRTGGHSQGATRDSHYESDDDGFIGWDEVCGHTRDSDSANSATNLRPGDARGRRRYRFGYWQKTDSQGGEADAGPGSYVYATVDTEPESIPSPAESTDDTEDSN